VTLAPDRTPPLITSADRKIELLQEAGAELILVMPFDAELAAWSPERFVAEVLRAGLGARAVVVGEGWRFGSKATGTVDILRALGRVHGFGVDALPLVELAGEAVSSSRTRAALEQGDMELARSLLARPFDIDGVVVEGDRRGHSLGYPTANLEVEEGLLQPPRGVYAGRARVHGNWHTAAINVGVNPTFGGDPASSPLRIEAYLLDLAGDIYGEVLRIEFWRRLRDERRFDTPELLVAQMERDVEETRALLC